MIKSVTVVNYLGESFKMELMRPEESGFIIQSITGIGPVKANINNTELSTGDGAVYNSSRLTVRNIIFKLCFLPNPTIEHTRQKSYKYFPVKKPIKLIFETDNRVSECSGYVESNEPDIFSKSVNIGDQISQIIGIFYPYRIDNYVKTVRSQKFYGRYMDDWYVMSPSKEELEDILENIKRIAADYGIHINTKKTCIVKLSSTYKYLQVRYTLTSTGKVIKRINPQRVTAFRRKLKKLAALVNDNKAKYEDVENMFRSWMGGNYKLMSKETRIGLLNLFEDLFDVEITFVKHEGAKKHRMIITPKGGIDADDH